jgi:acetolactate synthase-1/3 small subunit
MQIRTEAAERHTLAVVVDNEPGILARIAGLFTARGYNIESLTVSEITADKSVSRITIVTAASAHVMEQILAQLDRLVPVHSVTDLTAQGAHVERELALVKVAGAGDHRIEALRLADVYRARVVELRLRGHRRPRQDRQLRVADGRSRAGRGRSHRHRRHRPRQGRGLSHFCCLRRRGDRSGLPPFAREQGEEQCVSITITTPT